jgi:enoyl-CoA hydratase/carnithine racemase
MPASPLALEWSGRIASLVLDAPPKNTTDAAFFEELARLATGTLPGLDADGLVIRGRGRHFSSGADVAELEAILAAKGAAEAAPSLVAHGRALAQIEALPFPVVAAIDGACLGSRLELALACRFRLATSAALLGLPECSFGLMPGCGGTVRLRERVGVGKAMELILTGRLLDAHEALEAGLVDAVVARESLPAAAERLIRAGRAS